MSKQSEEIVAYDHGSKSTSENESQEQVRDWTDEEEKRVLRK